MDSTLTFIQITRPDPNLLALPSTNKNETFVFKQNQIIELFLKKKIFKNLKLNKSTMVT